MNAELELLQQRVEKLEGDVDALKSGVSAHPAQPWWERISGLFENDQVFAEIVRLGRDYRDAQGCEID